jgi:hypothetical protein
MLLTRRLLPIAAIWALLYWRYNSVPDNFENPGDEPGMARITYVDPDDNRFAKKYPGHVCSVDRESILLVRPVLNQLQAIDDHNPTSEYRIYYGKTDVHQKLTIATADLHDLYHYTDSLGKIHTPDKKITLAIIFEENANGDIATYSQAYAATHAATHDSKIILTAGLLHTRTKPEVKSVIGHELAHIKYGHHIQGTGYANMSEELEADYYGVVITGDLDARLRNMGKYERDYGCKTLLGAFIEDCTMLLGMSTHPTHIRRAQILAKAFE